MWLRLLLITAVIAPAMVWFPTHTNACSCVSLTPSEHLDRSDSAFRGVVTSIGFDDQGFGFLVEFDVLTVWKGTVSPTISVYTGETTVDCSGYRFEVGVEYVVFAGYSKYNPDVLYVGYCDGTLPVEYAEAALAELDASVQDIEDGAEESPEDVETEVAGYPSSGSGGLDGICPAGSTLIQILTLGVGSGAWLLGAIWAALTSYP